MSERNSEAETPYAWLRLTVSLALSTIGGVGMWSVVVALPAVQSEFGVARGDASLPYTLTMIGFGLASIGMGRLADRFGIMVPVIAGAIAMALGYAGAASAHSLGRHAANATDRRRSVLLRGDVDAAGASCRLLRRPRLWRRAWRADAVADARLRDREQVDVRIHLRPHRRAADFAARLGPAGLRAAIVPPLQRTRVALRDLGAVRPVPGWHRAVLRHHRARVLPAKGSRRPRRRGHHGHTPRHGAGRVD